MGRVVEIPDRGEIALMCARERAQLVQALAQVERELSVGFADVLDAEDRAGDFRCDGHRDVRGWYVALTGDDVTEAGVKVRTMRTLRTLPLIRDALVEGRMSLAQTRSLVGAHRNPRVREFLPFVEAQFVAEAAVLDAVEFAAMVGEFAVLADADGAEQHAQARHEHRHAHHSPLAGGYRGDYSCGAAQGAVIARVLQAFVDREFDADCADAKAAHGDGYRVSDLARSAPQRRMDALFAMCQAAASATPGLRAPAPLVNLVVDTRTLDEAIMEAATGVHLTPDFSDLRSRRCATTDGVQVPRSDMLAAALAGQVRRVVVDERRVVIDLGRRARLFTGSSREAVMLRNTRCVWAGCNVAASQAEADHLDPYAAGGNTDAEQGCPKCGKHNRWSTRGFLTRQDDHGRWHTLRPDGTSINDPPAA